MLSNKYLGGVPEGARAAKGGSLSQALLSPENIERIRGLDGMARERGQSLAQMAIAWVLRNPAVTSALVGASHWAQIEDCLGALRNLQFSQDELAEIDSHANDGGLNIWAASSQSG
jgi:L-glyceraldehyde 3-phosphate reductase